MDKINYRDLDLKNMEKYDTKSFQTNELYRDNGVIYKLFKYVNRDSSVDYEKKLEAIKELGKDYISNPKELIVEGGFVKGYTIDEIEGESLHKEINKKGMLKMMKVMLEASKNLEDFHNSNGTPNIGDFHFDNIIVDKDGKPIFIDVDSFGINGIESKGIPASLYSYYDFKRELVCKDQNDDRIAFMLSIFNRLADRDIFTVSHFAYTDYMGMYPFLEELYPVYFELKRRGSEIPETPYLHKVLKKNYE